MLDILTIRRFELAKLTHPAPEPKKKKGKEVCRQWL